MQSKTAIGAFIRPIKSRLGAPTAINAGAHKLARLLYRMLKFGKAYVETGQEAYEKLFKERTLRNLQRRARELGFDITPAGFHRISFLEEAWQDEFAVTAKLFRQMQLFLEVLNEVLEFRQIFRCRFDQGLVSFQHRLCPSGASSFSGIGRACPSSL